MMLQWVLSTYLMSLFLIQCLDCNGTEISLDQCCHSEFYPCSYMEDVGAICDTEPMKARLVNGTNAAGRLEIYFNGEWGTVCNYNFEKADAQVACRMLGFISTGAAAVGSVIYGQGSGRILLSDMYCKGEETSLEECSHSVFYPHGCSHREDVGVICNITEPLEARLINGTKSAGRLEIYFNGEWGTVCNSNFGKEEARVACRMLGFNNIGAAVVGSNKYGQGSGYIPLSNIYCKGEETSLEQCSYSVFYPNGCSHREDVGVVCNITIEPLKARLVNGTKSAGRLEIYFNGEWGTVINHEFKKKEAQVACRMLGFNNTEAAVVGSVIFGQGSGPILLSQVYCKGEETSLEHCSHSVFYPHGWSHEYDVGVICNITIEPLKARLVNGTKSAGRLEIYFNGEWGTVINHGFEKRDAQVACRMLGFNNTEAEVVGSDIFGQGSGHILLSQVYCKGEETSLEECSHSVFYPHGWSHQYDVGVICTSTTEPLKARLVNGTKSTGRLEIYFNGEWGTVCNNGFEKKAAKVACRMLGFNNTEAAVVSSDIFGQGSGRILLSQVYCKGEETSLEECSHSVFYPHGWSHQCDVGVICNIDEPLKARLVNGTKSAGRLEIYFNGKWGTVSNNGFRKDGARVACRMLGFNNTEAAVVNSDIYGQGSGHILLSQVYCKGEETSLEECSHSVFYPHGWSHQEDVGVICNITEPLKARLVNGTISAGRLEIYFNGEWGTVCNIWFGKNAAKVACRMLGFINTEGAVVSSDIYGQGSGRILLSDIYCKGEEISLEQCSYSVFYPHGCSHREDVGVICKINESLKARLVNGTNSAGRLEIYFNGQWGTVCDNGFVKENARVVCMMLGFNTNEAAVVSSVRYGQGSGPIHLNHMRCQGMETSLAKCSHEGFYPDCSHSKDAGVICKIMEPMRARLVNGSSAAGRLEIFFDGEWGTVCDDGFDKEEAQVACRMLGFNSTGAAAVPSVRYGGGRGHILIKTKRCHGTETSLTQCQDGPFYPQDCSHSQDVGVVCKISKKDYLFSQTRPKVVKVKGKRDKSISFPESSARKRKERQSATFFPAIFTFSDISGSHMELGGQKEYSIHRADSPCFKPATFFSSRYY